MGSKFLDARTKDNYLRLTAFSDSIAALVIDFKDWLKEHSIPKKMLWYADIFDCDELTHVCSLEPTEEGVMINPAPQDSQLSPFKRRRPLKYLLRKYD